MRVESFDSCQTFGNLLAGQVPNRETPMTQFQGSPMGPQSVVYGGRQHTRHARLADMLAAIRASDAAPLGYTRTLSDTTC